MLAILNLTWSLFSLAGCYVSYIFDLFTTIFKTSFCKFLLVSVNELHNRALGCHGNN